MSNRKNTVSDNTKKLTGRMNKRNTAEVRTYENAVEEFLKECELKGLSADTIISYAKELKNMQRVFGELMMPLINVNLIQSEHLNRYIQHLLDIGRAKTTINVRIGCARTFFNFCKRKKYVAANPFDDIRRLKVRHEIGATFTKGQLAKLMRTPNLETFVGLRDYTMMLGFAHTGVRLKELTDLNIQNISFEGKGYMNVQRTKNGYARRIPLTKQLKAALRLYIHERGQLDTDALFVTLTNDRIDPSTVQKRIKEYGKESDVQSYVQCSPHTFRRTFCRRKVEAGVNVFVLQRLTGHTSLEMLQRYVAIYGKDLDEAIEKGTE